jgi:hypothetical protein
MISEARFGRCRALIAKCAKRGEKAKGGNVSGEAVVLESSVPPLAEGSWEGYYPGHGVGRPRHLSPGSGVRLDR